MISSPATTKRLLIPRWRPFVDAVDANELASDPSSKRTVDPATQLELAKRVDKWRRVPTEATAAELVDAAIVLGVEEVASDAAQFLAAVHADVTQTVRRQSQQLLARLNSAATKPISLETSIRERLRETPEDATLWVDLALRQTIAGSTDAAVRSMKAALHLARDNRFVLRAASRLFSHIHTPDIGYDLLRRSSATEYDPWLMAAEIAMAGRVDKKPAFLRKGLSVLERHSEGGLQVSELAGAVATTSLEGHIAPRQAKKLFVQSLTVPTPNAVAQAEWASQATGQRFLEPADLRKTPRAIEARALYSYAAGRFPDALAAAREWIGEEQFSGRAHSFAAASANTLDFFHEAIEICRLGIRHDPKSPSLRNSLAFALASTGKLLEAEQSLTEAAQLSEYTDLNRLVADANRGLIAFRRGQLDVGAGLYQKAIAGFRRLGFDQTALIAQAYLTREAVKANHPEAGAFERRVRAEMQQRRNAVAARVLGTIERRNEDRDF